MGLIDESRTSAAANAGVSVIGSTGGGGKSSITGNAAAKFGGSSLEESDFDFESKASKKQQNVLIYGSEGQGKTTFCTMYAPGPVAYINFDRRGKVAVDLARARGRRIGYMEVPLPTSVTKLSQEDAQKAGQVAVRAVLKNFLIAVRESEKGNIRTICIDTGTEYSEVLNLAITGNVVGIKGDYGKSKELMNREWAEMYDAARKSNANLIVLARMKEVWKGNEPTGEFTYRGPTALGELADWAAQIRVVSKSTKGPAAAGGLLGGMASGKGSGVVSGPKEFQLVVTKAGNNIAELGAVYSSEDWEACGGPFAYAATMLTPGSTFEDWQ